MGGGDYVEGWVPLSAETEWVPPFRKPDSQEIVITAADWPSVDWPMSEAGGSSWTGECDWGEYHLGLGGYCKKIAVESILPDNLLGYRYYSGYRLRRCLVHWFVTVR